MSKLAKTYRFYLGFLLGFLTLICLCSFGYAGVKNTQSGFLDFNLYPYLSDVESDSTFTLNIGADLQHRFSYFSLLNFYNQESEPVATESTSFYSEQNIRWKVSEDSAYDITYQGNFRSGEENDRHRLGFRIRLNDTELLKAFMKRISLNYALNFHVLQYDHESTNVWQIEHSFFMRFPYITERLYLAGFIDHTFNENLPIGMPESPIVAEAQFGLEIIDNLYAALEFRQNDYRQENESNIALGVQYKVVW